MLQIYSDALDESLLCGIYLFDPLSFLAFNELEIPCSQEVIITIVELDSKDSESYTARIHCKEMGPISTVFKLNGYKMHA